MLRKSRRKLGKITVSLPYGIGKLELIENPVERKCAWELYVELVTRVSVQSLAADHGSAREALSSLHSLFGSSRQILRSAGPEIAKTGMHSVGGIALRVLNDGLRPFLSKWHVSLADWESKRPESVSKIDYESKWQDAECFRADLRNLREELESFAVALGRIAGVRD
jgi:hypothetical protein